MEFFAGNPTVSTLLLKTQDGLGELTAEERVYPVSLQVALESGGKQRSRHLVATSHRGSISNLRQTLSDLFMLDSDSERSRATRRYRAACGDRLAARMSFIAGNLGVQVACDGAIRTEVA
jgi:hypothetical protein